MRSWLKACVESEKLVKACVESEKLVKACVESEKLVERALLMCVVCLKCGEEYWILEYW